MALGIAARAPKFVQGKAVALSGGHLAAHAMRQMNPDLVAAYPITPQTVLMELFCQFVADGRVDTELLTVESEHAAMSACIGAAAAGAIGADAPDPAREAQAHGSDGSAGSPAG